MEIDNNKKTLILSIVGILVLVIAVVGVSFAMYNFTASGTKTNVINTGTLTLNFDTVEGGSDENYFNLTDEYPMTDEEATERTDNVTDFSVNAEWGDSAMTLVYDLGIELVGEPTLPTDAVKFSLKDTSSNTYLYGSATTGTTLDTITSNSGTNCLISGYNLTSGTFNETDKAENYQIRAWVSSDYDLAIDAANSTSPEASVAEDGVDGTLDNQGGKLHKKTTASKSLSFKLVLIASQSSACTGSN